MRNSKTIAAVALLLATTAIDVHAQPAAATKKVKVTFTGPRDCRKRIQKDINVVIEGDEANPVPASRQADPNEWRGKLADKADPKMVRGTRASLRLGGLRTNCEKSVYAQDEADLDAGIASFTFQCIPQPATSLDLQIDPHENPIGFVRWVAKSPNCRDWAFFESGSTIVEDIWPSEEVRLHFGSDHNVDGRGLLVLLSTSSETLLTFSKPIETLAAHEGESHRFEKRSRIALALAYQRATGDGTAPHLSSTAIDIDTKLLDKAGVQALTIQVIK